MIALVILTLQIVTSEAATPDSSMGSPSRTPLLRRGLVQNDDDTHDATVPRRLAYPSVGQLLKQPDSISEIDVIVSKALHQQCVDILMYKYPKESALVRVLELNLTQWNLQSATTNVDKQQNKISIVLVSANGTQAVYTEQLTSHSFGCTVADPKYTGIMSAAQSKIDGLNYVAAPDLASAPPERDLASFEAYSAGMCDPLYNQSRAFLIYQKGKLVWEKYCTPGFDKSSVLTIDGDGGYSFATMWPNIRHFEGKFDLDKLSYCPELKQLEKRARNMTARNLMSWRIGRPLQNVPSSSKRTKPKLMYDTEKMLWLVADKANYAAVVPSSYGDDIVPLEWGSKHYFSAGTGALLQRELRYTFPATSQGFTDYAAYPWTHLFSQIAASSFTVEADASGTFVGHYGLHANARDFLKLGALMVQQGKWFDKQVLPAEYVNRNLYNPHGADQAFGEGWHSFKFPGVPRLLYHIAAHGGFYICPGLELVILDIQNGNNPKRTETLIFKHLRNFLNSQVAAWSTTTTTTTTRTSTSSTTTITTSTITTSTALTTSPSVTLAMSTATSTSAPAQTEAPGASTTAAGVESLTSLATRSGSLQWMLLLSMILLKVVGQSGF